jgi:hypothetical protein
MKKAWLFILIAALATGIGLSAQTIQTMQAGVQVQNDNSLNGPNVIPRDSVAYGRTYSEWNAAWQQWAMSLPTASNPLFDNGADCSAGQSGPVWFLGGKFCQNGGTCNYTNIRRSCTIPSTKAIYFPILSYEDSAVEESIAENPGSTDAQQIDFMRAATYTGMDAATVSAWVDGRPIPKLREKFRSESTVFGFTLPANNILTSIYGTTFPTGPQFPAVDDGWYVMLAPLSVGHHVLQFAGTNGNFTLSMRYDLNVTK